MTFCLPPISLDRDTAHSVKSLWLGRWSSLLFAILLIAAGLRGTAQAQEVLSWDDIRQRFEQNNPTLLADKLSVDESKAQEITAFLRPNPNLIAAGGWDSDRSQQRRLAAVRRHV